MELWRKLECFGNEVGGTGLGLHLAAAAAQFNLPGRYAEPSLIIWHLQFYLSVEMDLCRVDEVSM